MGRFARKSERVGRNGNRPQMTARPQFSRSFRYRARGQQAIAAEGMNFHAPSDRKYFLLALAALIGLGVCSLLAKAVTNQNPQAPSPPAVERAAPAMPGEAGGQFTEAKLMISPEVKGLSESPSDVTAAPSSTNATQIRNGGKVTRRVYRRNAGESLFSKPINALRKIGGW